MFKEYRDDGVLFQFHKGSIKTTDPLLHLAHVVVFQFHKGSIKTTSRRSSTSPFFYFNSIKVRLRHCKFLDMKVEKVYFNSIKVRLRPPRASQPLPSLPFQFHKGSIKTRAVRIIRREEMEISIP